MASSKRALTRLQTNPDLVLWPGSDAECFLVDTAGRPTAAFSMPHAALRVLAAFSEPRTIGEVFDSVAEGASATIGECLEQRLLLAVKSRRPPRSPSALWGGFRFGDHAAVARLARGRFVVRRHRLAGRELVVLDGALPWRWTRSIHRWFFQLPFQRVDVDTFATTEYRHWIRSFNPALHYAATVPLVRALEALAREMLDATRYTLRRLDAYSTNYGDVLTPHRDRERGKGMTAVYFGNAEWDDAWMGEMLFYDEHRDPTIAVAPRPGRLVVFDAELVHRGGAPSRACHETRYSFVLKFS